MKSALIISSLACGLPAIRPGTPRTAALTLKSPVRQEKHACYKYGPGFETVGCLQAGATTSNIYNQLNTIILPAIAGKSIITIENYKNQIHVETIKLRR